MFAVRLPLARKQRNRAFTAPRCTRYNVCGLSCAAVVPETCPVTRHSERGVGLHCGARTRREPCDSGITTMVLAEVGAVAMALRRARLQKDLAFEMANRPVLVPLAVMAMMNILAADCSGL